MDKYAILIVEDERSIRTGLEDDLILEGYRVRSAKDGHEGFELARKHPFDLIILDIMLPGMDGMDLCRRLRRLGRDTPIIFLTAKDRVEDRIRGLDLGGDDYITKPFSPGELMARVKAILRRTSPESNLPGIFRFGDIEVNFESYKVSKDGTTIHLTASEFTLLRFFIENQMKVLGRDSILDRVWGHDVYITPRTVDTHVAHLRKKIEDDPAHPRYIISVHGVGYRFEPEAGEGKV
jgi:DNA-binding response OmpR family regulator